MFVCGRVLLKYKKRQKNSDTDIRRGTESTPLQFFKFHEVPCKGMVLYRSLDDFMEKAVAPYSSTLAWKIPWMEEPGRLQSMGSLRVGHDWATSLSLFTFMHWRRKWQPTPVLLLRKSHGRRSLVGCSPLGRWGSDTTERLHFHFSLACIGEGNGNPLQCSCLENPRDEPGGLPSMGSHRVEHDWSDLAAADDFNFAFQEITVQQLMAHLDSIRKDMVILEKSEFANLRAENQVIQVSIN